MVHFIETCYCLEAGLYSMATEIPVLNKYFDDILEVRDARFRNQCTMECEFCDCTRSIKLPGKSLVSKLDFNSRKLNENNYLDIGRILLNRKKQKEGIKGLKNSLSNNNNKNKDINNKIKPIFGGAAISGLFAIVHDGIDYFRVKNIPDTPMPRQMLENIGLQIYGDVYSIKSAARSSLARCDKRSNVV